MRRMVATASPKSRKVAFCLSLLCCVGMCGVHRLYAGKVFTFILQLVTLGFFGMWQLVDIIRILLGSFEDARGREISEW